LVLTSQADDEWVIVKNPGAANQSVSALPLADAKRNALRASGMANDDGVKTGSGNLSRDTGVPPVRMVRRGRKVTVTGAQ